MAKEIENSKIVQLSMRVSQSCKDEFYRILEEGAYETCGLCMDALLERYHNPLKINQDNERKVDELTGKVDEQSASIHLLTVELENANKMYQEQKSSCEKLTDSIDQLKSDNADLSKRLEQLAELENDQQGKILVPVNRIDELCLEYLANRENKRRKRNDITPATFFMYAIREMIIKGNKFSIDSVPDKVIAQFENQIKDEQHTA